MAQAKPETPSRSQINFEPSEPPPRSGGGRDRFVKSVADMAAEVWDFHERFGIDGGGRATRSCHEVIIERAPYLREEIEEMLEAANSKDEPGTCHEAADVLFVAIGNIVSLGSAGEEGVRNVTAKNAEKTHETHAIRPDTGKLLPIRGKPHKWL